MCVACGQELCKNCKGCHNVECELYTEPTATCESKKEPLLPKGVGDGKPPGDRQADSLPTGV